MIADLAKEYMNDLFRLQEISTPRRRDLCVSFVDKLLLSCRNGDVVINNVVKIKPLFSYRSPTLKRPAVCQNKDCAHPKMETGERGWWRIIDGGPRYQDDGPYHRECAKATE